MPGMQIGLLLVEKKKSILRGKKIYDKPSSIPWPNDPIIQSKPMQSYPMNPSKAPRVSGSPVAWNDPPRHDPKRGQNDKATK